MFYVRLKKSNDCSIKYMRMTKEKEAHGIVDTFFNLVDFLIACTTKGVM